MNPLHPRDPALASLFPVDDSDTGVDVTAASAMTLSAVWAAVNLLSSTIGSLPLVVNRKLSDGGRIRDPSHRLYEILHSNANADQTSLEWREMTQGHLSLRGNAYSEIISDSRGNVVELLPHHPEKLRPERMKTGALFYVPPEGLPISADRIIHLRGLATNGIMGLSPIAAARRSLGLAIAAEKFGGKFFANSARPSGVLKMPGTLNEDGQKRLKASWDSMHSGVENASKTAVLEQGLEYQAIGLSPDDAQFLGTIAAGVTNVARWFRLPPHMIADLERATFSNIEHQDINFVVHSIRPWLARWEQRLESDLLTKAERKTHEIRFVVEGLLRGDSAARSAFYTALFNIGAVNRNQIRALEGMNPIDTDDGDTYFVPLNMIPAEQASNFYGGAARSAQPEENRSLPIRVETRARTKIAQGFKPMFLDLAQRVVRAEDRELRKGLEKYLAGGSSEVFFEWVERRYAFDGDFRNWIGLQSRAAMESLATVIDERAASEIGGSATPEVDLAQFASLLAVSFANRHVGSSRGQLRKIATLAADEVSSAIEAKLDGWSSNRAERISSRETIKASRAIAREAFRRGGIQRLRWVATGDNCPFCDSLDGKIVGIEDAFAGPGDILQAEGRSPLPISQKILHAPIHAGCDCDIVPA